MTPQNLDGMSFILHRLNLYEICVTKLNVFYVSLVFIRLHRDLGEYLRKQLKASLRTGDISLNGEVSLDRQFQALERLSNNIHFKSYPRSRDSSSTGLKAEQCKIIISDTSMKYFEEQEKKGIFRNFFKNSNKPQ